MRNVSLRLGCAPDRATLARLKDEAQAMSEFGGKTVYRGYLIDVATVGNIASAKVIDLPSKLLVPGNPVLTGRPSRNDAGERAPWVPADAAYGEIPDTTSASQPFITRSATIGTLPPNVVGAPVPSQKRGLWAPSLGNFGPTFPTQGFTRFGSPCASRSGWWQTYPVFDEAAGVTLGDLYGFNGAVVDDVPHWISVKSGYLSPSTWSDIRLAKDFIEAAAPGYTTFIPTGDIDTAPRRSFPIASACRRTVSGENEDYDLLAVSLGVIKSVNGVIDRTDCGVSGLLVCLFQITAESVIPLRTEVFEVQDLGPEYDLVPIGHASLPDTFEGNHTSRHATIIRKDGVVEVHGVWEVNKPTKFDGSTGGGYDYVPIANYYRATVDVNSGASFTHLYTSTVFYPPLFTATSFDVAAAFDSDPNSAIVHYPSGVSPFLIEYEDDDGTPYIRGGIPTYRLLRDRCSSLFVAGGSTRNIGVRTDIDDNTSGMFYTHDSTFRYGAPSEVMVHKSDEFMRGTAATQTMSLVGGSYVSDFTWAWLGGPTVARAAFDANSAASQIVFHSLNTDTGAWSARLAPIVTGTPWYLTVPLLSVYQQEVKDEQGGVVRPEAFIVNFATIDNGYVPQTFVWRQGFWEVGPEVSGEGGVHFIGNGFFGAPLQMFDRV